MSQSSAVIAVLLWLFSIYANYRIISLVYTAFTQECYRMALFGFSAWVGIHLVLM
jgi:hypothetical protein